MRLSEEPRVRLVFHLRLGRNCLWSIEFFDGSLGICLVVDTQRSNYQSAQKRGAYQLSTVCESLDAHRWIEHMERVFVRLQVPEVRNVGLAMEFLEDEPLCWQTDIVMGNLVIPHGPNSRGGFLRGISVRLIAFRFRTSL